MFDEPVHRREHTKKKLGFQLDVDADTGFWLEKGKRPTSIPTLTKKRGTS